MIVRIVRNGPNSALKACIQQVHASSFAHRIYARRTAQLTNMAIARRDNSSRYQHDSVDMWISSNLWRMILNMESLRQWQFYKVCRLTKITASPSIGTTSTLIIGENTSRIGAVLWNNSANSAYIALAATGDSSNSMTYILASFASLVLPIEPIYQGPISAKRNAGSGSIVITEFLADGY
jgi:hypothetical protein